MPSSRSLAGWCVGAVALCASSCVKTYSDEPALSYQQVPYESADGQAWPAKSLALPEIQQRFVMKTRPRLTYVELGPSGGRPVIFLHGLGSNLKFWRYQLDEMARQGHHVFALDMLGYGKSDKPASFPYTMEAMAEVVRAFIARVLPDGPRPVLVGHSMGGQMALSFAIRFPDEIDALVLTAPAGFEEFGDRERRWLEKVFTVNLVAGATEYEIWGNVAYNNFYRWRPELEWLVEERVRNIKDPTFRSYAYAQVKSVRGLTANELIRQNLDKVKVPAVIIHGDKDRLIPNPFMHGGSTRGVMEYGHERIAGSKLVTLEACGHSVQLDCPEEYNRELAAFLSALPPPRPALRPAAPPAAPAPAPADSAAAPAGADASATPEPAAPPGAAKSSPSAPTSSPPPPPPPSAAPPAASGPPASAPPRP
jgi:pimeloyl-ACP methyl ester carboxylesterase